MVLLMAKCREWSRPVTKAAAALAGQPVAKFQRGSSGRPMAAADMSHSQRARVRWEPSLRSTMPSNFALSCRAFARARRRSRRQLEVAVVARVQSDARVSGAAEYVSGSNGAGRHSARCPPPAPARGAVSSSEFARRAGWRQSATPVASPRGDRDPSPVSHAGWR